MDWKSLINFEFPKLVDSKILEVLASNLAIKGLKLEEIEKLIEEYFNQVDKLGFNDTEIEKYININGFGSVEVIFKYPNGKIRRIKLEKEPIEDMRKETFLLFKENLGKLIALRDEVVKQFEKEQEELEKRNELEKLKKEVEELKEKNKELKAENEALRNIIKKLADEEFKEMIEKEREKREQELTEEELEVAEEIMREIEEDY